MTIRREATTPGAPARWILISQLDHARLAGELAKHWGAGDFAPLVPRDELLWAIYHHDDGWREWEQSPDVDRARGWPRSFTEMELADSLPIWTGSIELAAAAGPLQAYVVAGHFCALLERVVGWRRGAAGSQQMQHDAHPFLGRYQGLMANWLRDWQAADPAVNTRACADLALRQLQFFDALSLWFCCAPATEPEGVETPGGPVLTLKPADPEHIQWAPWPLSLPRLNLEIPGRAVAVGHYSNRAELAAAPSQPVLLRWQVQPDAPKS